MYDTENYLVTARDIRGPWSDPVALNNFGFDPSLFHDDDGRKYMVSMVTDHRVPKKYAGRLVLQEYDPKAQRMVGPVRDIYRADRIFLEGPHIFKKNGWYYLFSADTGTGKAHGQTIQRSRSVWGPYEMYRPADPLRQDGEAYSILTSRHHEDILLQKSGHCDLVETPEGEWYAVHLCGRASERRNPPNAPRFADCRRYMLGRETAIQKMRWTQDGWLELDADCMPEGRTASFSNIPLERVPAPACAANNTSEACGGPDNAGPAGEAPFYRDDFDSPALALDYQSLRIPMDSHYLSLTERPGWLRMYGRSGLSSYFSQTLIARRMTEYHMTAEACVSFEPDVFKQMAGLILMYDTDNYLYLHLSRDEDVGKCITLLKAENRSYEYLTDYIPLEEGRDVILRLSINGTSVQFFYGYRDACRDASPAGALIPAGGPVDASFLSDEACREGWFTGTMIGICCQDLTGFGKHADFDWFEVRPEGA